MPDTALLLMDLQPEILDRFAVADGYIDRVVEVQARAEAAGDPVVLVHVGFRPDYPEVAARNKIFGSVPSTGGMVLGRPQTEPHPRLRRGHGEIVVAKKRVSAFAGSDLADVVRARGIGHLVLAGVATSGVVLSTVREAADRDYEITVLEDLCRDRDEEVHRPLIEKVFPRQCEVIPSTAWRR
jgi:nicotinamidase-related amidase